MPNGTKGVQQPFTPEWASWPMAKRVAAAKDLLKQAGYSDAKPLSFTLTYNTNDLHKKVALFTASEWRTKLGVNTKLENVEFKVLMKQRHDGKVQIARDGWFADYNDAMTFDLIRCGSAQNTVGYCNKQVDTLVDEGNQKLDEGARRAAHAGARHGAERHADGAAVPVFGRPPREVVRGRLFAEERDRHACFAGHVPDQALSGAIMLAYALRRTLWAVPTILAVVTVCYLLLHFTPGGPFDTEKQLSAATLANLNAKYHLDEPLWKQYLLYLNALLHGDLGPSFRYVDWSVNDLVKKALPVSLGVGGVSIPISIVCGVLLGTVAAVRRDSFIDRFVMLIGNFGNVIPPFVLGPVLVWIFAILLKTSSGDGWLPAGGWGDGGWGTGCCRSCC